MVGLIKNLAQKIHIKNIKIDEFTARIKSTIEFIEQFFKSDSYKEKEKVAIDTLFKNVNLPIPLRPFKPLLKKILRNKVKKLVSKYLKKLDAKF